MGKLTRRKRLLLGLALALLPILFYLPQAALRYRARNRVYTRVDDVPRSPYGVVFGARVDENGVLSPAARERVEAGVLLYQAGKVNKLYLSGDNRHNYEVLALKSYAESRGVPPEDIAVDLMGIDTRDTCRHLKRDGIEPVVLLTQAYHLPRAMYMCDDEHVDSVGLAVNRLDLLLRRGDSRLRIYSTRTGRSVREALLTWSYLLGLYDRLSDEAEKAGQ
jgi:vancomycin permeability regulator SanA